MKTFSNHRFGHPARPLLTIALGAAVAAGCAAHSDPLTAREPVAVSEGVNAGRLVIESDRSTPRPPFVFTDDESRLLDRVQEASFSYFWNQCDPETGLVHDRSSHDTVTVAGVGFGLSALPIAVERGWVTRDRAGARAARVLRSLLDEPTNRKAGLFYHFLNPDGSPRRIGTELVVSTVDSAILFCGAIVVGEYFGGEVADLADRMLADADWTFFQHDNGFLTLGWKPASDDDPTGDGSLLPYAWLDSGDEHRLTTLLAVCAPTPAHRIEPEVYFGLRRQIGRHEPVGEVIWFPYSGALFTAFFAHCWIDYAGIAGHHGPDDPASWGFEHRARADWWENSRRLVHLHRDEAIRNPLGLPTLGADAWGLSACDGPEGYLVPGVYPERVRMIGAVPGDDYSEYKPTDRWGDGVVAPYAAASSVVFEPKLALAAMRHYAALEWDDGRPMAWKDPDDGGFGFVDSFRTGDEPWVAEDGVAIDHGPMLLLIENARTGLVWDMFMSNPAVRTGLERLGLGGSPARRP